MKRTTERLVFGVCALILALPMAPAGVAEGDDEVAGVSYRVVDTGQDSCYGTGRDIPCPRQNQPYFGQDAQYRTSAPSYRDNGDGTVTDLNTGLQWQKRPIFFKRNQAQAEQYTDGLTLAGHGDWRLPTIKELFSLADFRGNMRTRTPYIDTTVFDFEYPRATEGESARPGERELDAQYASSTRYLGVTMGRDTSAFGFNFADGRVKSYPVDATRFVRAVRGNRDYGKNRFEDAGDGTIKDHATGLIWQQADSGESVNWEQALSYAEALELAGADDWRLPDVKELQSIVDYSRAPDAVDESARAPAIDPLFESTDPESWYWSSTTHIENRFAYYVSFGQAFSAVERHGKRINAHGAGAVRSDPKAGDPGRWPDGLGPQADQIRVLNYVRCVRGGGAELLVEEAGAEAVPVPGQRRSQRRAGEPRTTRGEDGGLRVTTLGTGSPLFNPERSGPSALIEYGQRSILVDMGEGTANQLYEASVPLKSIAAFCFTHHHRDHDADAASILPQAWSRGVASPVIGPRGTASLVDFLQTFYEEDLGYRVENRGGSRQEMPRPVVYELPLARPLTVAGVTISVAPVEHSIETFAYRFAAGGRAIVVSGDLRYSESLIELARDADVLVIDSGGIVYVGDATGGPRASRSGVDARSRTGAKNSRAHASLEEVARMAAGANVDKLVLTHFRPGFVDEERTLDRMRPIFSGQITFAEDLRTYR